MIAILLSVVGALFAGNLWWMRRLISSNDEFKTFVRERLESHGEQLAGIRARHGLEDREALGRRSYDPRLST